MFWSFVAWILRAFGDPGASFTPGDEMDNAPEPDGDDSIHQEVIRGVSQ